jgi:hypothetical protein
MFWLARCISLLQVLLKRNTLDKADGILWDEMTEAAMARSGMIAPTPTWTTAPTCWRSAPASIACQRPTRQPWATWWRRSWDGCRDAMTVADGNCRRYGRTSTAMWHLDGRRIPILLSVPVVIHWLSCEPLLEPLNLRRWLGRSKVDWIVLDGEFGPHHGPMELDWCRDLMQRCREAGAAFFMKQVSARFRKDGVIPGDLMMRDHPT